MQTKEILDYLNSGTEEEIKLRHQTYGKLNEHLIDISESGQLFGISGTFDGVETVNVFKINQDGRWTWDSSIYNHHQRFGTNLGKSLKFFSSEDILLVEADNVLHFFKVKQSGFNSALSSIEISLDENGNKTAAYKTFEKTYQFNFVDGRWQYTESSNLDLNSY